MKSAPPQEEETEISNHPALSQEADLKGAAIEAIREDRGMPHRIGIKNARPAVAILQTRISVTIGQKGIVTASKEGLTGQQDLFREEGPIQDQVHAPGDLGGQPIKAGTVDINTEIVNPVPGFFLLMHNYRQKKDW